MTERRGNETLPFDYRLILWAVVRNLLIFKGLSEGLRVPGNPAVS